MVCVNAEQKQKRGAISQTVTHGSHMARRKTESMQGDPVYDYPDVRPMGERRTCAQRGSLRSISVLDRLLLTHPVWLQLSINSATALHILRREPPGTFLVRKSSTSQKKMLCVRLADDSMPSFFKQVIIREEDSAFSLESSAISFPDLCRLIAFYCVSRYGLNCKCQLMCLIKYVSPDLDALLYLTEFWSSHLNELCRIQTRSPCELDYGGGKGLCFVNPLFLQDYPGRNTMHRRHNFKTSFKVRVSTENSSPLSPPILPPPPPPLLAKAKSTDYMQPCDSSQKKRHAPSLSELDSSSSLSSLDETEESPERPPLVRGTSNPVMPPPRKSMSALRKMSAAFISFFTPEKRVARMVEDLSRDRRMAFGALVQDFLRQQREALKPHCLTSAVQLLQDLRHFINQAKAFLLECGELEPPIETVLTENEKALEKAMFRCVLKPLKPQIDAALRTLHKQDGSFQRMVDSLQRANGASPQKLFGVQRAYSPIDKVLLLLQICKLIYKTMKNKSGQEFGADDFLPALAYVMVLCNMPEISLEVEYMMELLESSWLTGEGGYYLTSVYASLSLIQSQPEDVPPNGLTNQARESLKEWSRRRSNETISQKDLHQVRYTDGDNSLVKTLVWKTALNGEAMAQLCAVKFGVDRPEDYSLYWRRDGVLTPLPPNTQIQDLQSMGVSGVALIYQASSQDERSQKLNRGKKGWFFWGGQEFFYGIAASPLLEPLF
uniref:Ras and Rab interactor 1a n=1 Tax=Cyprinus carpio TaxID=7962 RepID=A0A8C2I0W9_CYPCA